MKGYRAMGGAACLLVAAMAAGCGIVGAGSKASSDSSGGKARKVFAEGDPYIYDDPESIVGTAEEQATAALEQENARRISIPPNRQEERGLRLIAQPQALTVSAGDTLYVTVMVRNLRATPETIGYPTDQRFDVVVFADVNQQKPVHLWSEGRPFIRKFDEVVIGGGALVSRVLEIPTTKDRAVEQVMGNDLTRPLLPGKYWLYATNEGNPFLATGPIEIEVVE